MVAQELDFSPLSSLVEVTGYVPISTGNTSINRLSCLKSVGGNLDIQSNNGAESIDGFQPLESIGNDLNILINANLNSINAFPLLETVGRLNIQGNPNLRSTERLDALNRDNVVGDIIIASNLSFDFSNTVNNARSFKDN